MCIKLFSWLFRILRCVKRADAEIHNLLKWCHQTKCCCLFLTALGSTGTNTNRCKRLRTAAENNKRPAPVVSDLPFFEPRFCFYIERVNGFVCGDKKNPHVWMFNCKQDVFHFASSALIMGTCLLLEFKVIWLTKCNSKILSQKWLHKQSSLRPASDVISPYSGCY